MKVVGFGDYLMHFSPVEKMRFYQADLMRLSFTGAEANVCCALGFWGEETGFVTKLPKNAISKKGVSFLKAHDVETANIEYGIGRMGVYFLESGFSLRSSQVIYDRDNSLFVNSDYDDYNWDKILSDADVFYFSGITPSLSESLFECCKLILAECKTRNIPVFCDVNLRPTICNIEKSREIFGGLYPYITHLIGNEEHLKQIFNIDLQESENENRLYDIARYISTETGIDNIAITVRRTPSANKAVIYAAYYSGTDFALSKTRHIDVVDRVGSGDAFSAGLLYSFIHKFSVTEAVEFATASSAVKHTINNDVNFATVEEIKGLMHSKGCDVKR